MATALRSRAGEQRKTRSRTTLDLIGEQILEGLSNLVVPETALGKQINPIGAVSQEAGRLSVQGPELLRALTEPVTSRRPEGGLATVQRLISGQEDVTPVQTSTPKKQEKSPSETDDTLSGIDLAIAAEKKNQGKTLAEQQILDKGLDNVIADRDQFASELDAGARRNIEQAQQARNLIDTGETDPGVGTRLLKGILNLGSAILEQRPPSTTLAEAQAIAGTEPIQPSEILAEGAKLSLEEFKQDRLDARERLKAELKEGGTDSKAQSLKLMGFDVGNLIAARQKVLLKGPIKGPIGAVAGLIGIDRGDRASFESFGTQLAFSYGEHILGQKGRAFTDNERKEISNKIIAASLSKSNSQFASKMQAIIDQVNVRIRTSSKLSSPAFLPSFDEIDANLKAGIDPFQGLDTGTEAAVTPSGGAGQVGTQFTGTTASGIKFTLEE